MTMKKIALALLSTAVMADQGCAPEPAWGTQNHFSVEFAGGAATMGGSPYSTTPTAAFPDQTWSDVAIGNTATDAPTLSATLEVITPVGYRANWNQMQGNPNRLGFAGQLNMHYLAVQGNFAGGVYAGIGYNGAHSSSTIQGTFDNTVYVNNLSNTALPAGESMTVAEGPYSMQTDGARNPYPSPAQQSRAAINANQPPAKATVSSGVMFQAGTRMGVMIGNVFPHLRLGWAAYQLKAHMTGQMPAGSQTSSGELYANSTQTLTWDGDDKYETTPTAATDSVLIGINQQLSLTGVDNLYNLPKTIKIASKGSKWSNALTLGAGVDWAWQKMTFGFYYQAAMCQRVTFKQWNKAVSAGVTSSDVNWETTSTTNTVAAANDTTQLTGTGLTNTYGASVPSLSISPVIHTAMFSVKYVINKA